jgi:hypothetical protein
MSSNREVIARYLQARAILRENPRIRGAELGRRMGVSDRTGAHYRTLVLSVGPLDRQPEPPAPLRVPVFKDMR